MPTQFSKVINVDTLIKGRVRVEWVELGEGWIGDYNPDNPEDEELLRFDVSWWLPDTDDPENLDPTNENAFGDWSDPGDASYCTAFPVKATPEQRQKGLELIMGEVYEPLVSGHSIKKLCERLSWIGLDWLDI
jgi:hypothetical protein